MNKDFLLLAHRGCSLLFEENTEDAFVEAAKSARAVEFDVRQTRDGKNVVFHDPNTKRLCGVRKPVGKTDYADLPKTLQGNRILLLEEVLDICQNLKIHMEIKDNNVTKTLPKLGEHILVSSFLLDTIHFLKGKHPTLFLTEKRKDFVHFENSGARYLGIPQRLANATLPAERSKTFIYTVNIPELVLKSKEMGFGGVYCDGPENVLKEYPDFYFYG